MLFARSLSAAELAALFRRVSVSLAAGVDVRRTWNREADMARGRAAAAIALVRDGVASGDSLHACIVRGGVFWPALVGDLVKVGEEAGTLPEACRHLADYYEQAASRRRTLFRVCLLPSLQLAAVLFIFGAVIAIGGVIGTRPVDVLGWGMAGAAGLVRYLILLALLAAGGYAFSRWLVRRWQSGALEGWIARLPVVGRAIQEAALARFCGLLRLTTASGLPMERVVELSLGSSGSRRLAAAQHDVWQSIRGGDDLHEALAATGLLPAELLAAVEVGQESGRLPQSMAAMERHYQGASEARARQVVRFAGFLIWIPMALLVINRVMAIYGGHINQINNALGR